MTIRLGPLLLTMTALVAVVVGLQAALQEDDESGGLPAISRPASVAALDSLDASPVQSSETVADARLPPVEEVAFPVLLPPDAVARMIAQTASGDAQLRATAIGALATAPRSDAVPVLRDLLNNGEPSVDRPLALQALRDLALHQGDDDGAIRSAVRETIYHGDDEGLALSAQGALEVIEESEMQ